MLSQTQQQKNGKNGKTESTEKLELAIKSVPSGTAVFDWTVPKEWRIREAYISNDAGERIVDFKNNNLHVMGYSTPVDKWCSFDELKSFIYTQPDQPEVIPYVTSYYKERFGFCLSQQQLSNIEKEDKEYTEKTGKPRQYHMFIDSELFDGVLNYGEIIIPATRPAPVAKTTTNSTAEIVTAAGADTATNSVSDSVSDHAAESGNTPNAHGVDTHSVDTHSAETDRGQDSGQDSDQEIFFSTYVCHPSMANNECSGPSLAVALIKYVAAMPNRRYSYRFIFIPETIGSLTYLATEGHLSQMKERVIAGFNLSCVGDDRAYSIVESRYGDTLADRVLRNVLKFHTATAPNTALTGKTCGQDNCGGYMRYSFLQRGSDERQYNAPGVDLPVVCFCRSKFGEYPEYHTSADDMRLVSPEGFQGSFDVMTEVITALEGNKKYKTAVLGEPQLGKRGLYPTVSKKGSYGEVKAMTDLIAYSDGKMDLIEISDRIGVDVGKLIEIAEKLSEHGLLTSNEVVS